MTSIPVSILPLSSLRMVLGRHMGSVRFQNTNKPISKVSIPYIDNIQMYECVDICTQPVDEKHHLKYSFKSMDRYVRTYVCTYIHTYMGL